MAIALAFMYANTVEAQDVKEGLFGYWKFDEGEGNTVADSADDGTDGVIEGATWVKDPNRGWVLSFDGVDDRVHINNNTFRFDAPFTLAAWIKTSRDLGGVISKCNGDTIWDSGEKAFHVIDSTDWEVWAGITAKPGNISMLGWGCEATTGGDVDDGEWHHVAFTYNGTTASGTLYIEGSKVEPDLHRYTIGVRDQDSHTLYIGWAFNGHLEAFDGLIDSVYLYNRALTADEVAQIKEERAAVSSANRLIATWGRIKI